MPTEVRLRLESLEARDVPTTTAPVVAPVVAPVLAPLAPSAAMARPTVAPPFAQPAPLPIVTPPQPPPIVSAHPVAGAGSGSYISTLQAGGVPTGFHFNGMMDVKGMGRVVMQASIYGVGFGTTPARGRITLSNARGSVILELTAAPQSRLSPLPQWFRYRIVHATGAYKDMTDSGTLRLTRYIDPIPVRHGIRYAETGAFRLII